jgi:hypothetical protein
VTLSLLPHSDYKLIARQVIWIDKRIVNLGHTKSYSLHPKDIVQFTIFLCPIHIVKLLLGRVQTLACTVVERQWTSNVVRERALSSHLLLAHVGLFVIVSATTFHDLDKALRDKNTFFSLSWPIALKGSMTALISSSMLFGPYWC